VLDGVPLTDHRSPRFGPEIEADDVPSMSVYTAGTPAEYGRKMGGVIEIDTNTNRDPRRPIGARFSQRGVRRENLVNPFSPGLRTPMAASSL
jgi:hypothetical protein